MLQTHLPLHTERGSIKYAGAEQKNSAPLPSGARVVGSHDTHCSEALAPVAGKYVLTGHGEQAPSPT
eukprot:345957-Rhodomonas_salina.2